VSVDNITEYDWALLFCAYTVTAAAAATTFVVYIIIESYSVLDWVLPSCW